jgi:outer membrane protein, multidrug efflux system
MKLTISLYSYSLVLSSAALISCSAVGPNYQEVKPVTPPQWYAPVQAHQGSTAALTNWWQQFDDALLAQLIDAAQAESDTLASALSRIEQSRASAVATRSALLPSANLSASGSRSNSGNTGTGAQTSARASVDALWEIDLFGGNKRNREAALARLESSKAQWHSARVSLAAEVATQYVSFRACEALAKGFAADSTSRMESDRLTQLKVKAGFTAPADGSLSSASVAEAASRLTGQKAECEVTLKSLVALTAIDEPKLREQLASSSAKLPQPASIAIDTLPAKLIAQRPDIASAERDLAAASADIGAAEAARYPSISLLGSIGYSALRFAGVTSEGRTWSFGPALDLPLFDAGRRAANADAARAKYVEALALYKARVRGAVREVEQGLVQLGSAKEREADAQAAVTGYEAFVKASDARYRAGAGSLLELEDARRVLLTAQVAQLNVQRERISAWITLYKAAGGGWSADAEIPQPPEKVGQK